MVELPDAEGPKVFSYDEEWLAVLRTTHSLLSLNRRPVPLPGSASHAAQEQCSSPFLSLQTLRVSGACCAGMGALRGGASPEDLEYVRSALAARGGPEVPQNFAATAPGHDGRQRRGVMPTTAARNPQVRCTQTEAF